MPTNKLLLLIIITLLASCRQETELTFKQRFDKLKTLNLPITIKDTRDIPKFIDNTNWVWDSSVVGKNVIPIGLIKKTPTHYTVLFSRQKENGVFIATFDTLGQFIDSIGVPIGNFIAHGEKVHFLSQTIFTDTLETKGYLLNPKINPIGDEPIDSLFLVQANVITFANNDKK